MSASDWEAAAASLLALYRGQGLRLATAESCTGGLIAARLTAVAGSSDVILCGFVTYSNEAKADMLGVPLDMIAAHGAVSEPVARAMAEGVLRRSDADVAVSVTGVAGPGGGTPTKPVGLVHFGLARRGYETRHLERQFGDLGRGTVRDRAVRDAFGLLGEAAGA